MQPAQPGELGILQPRNGAEQADLLGMFELGLETDHVPQRAQLVILPQLHHGMRPAPLGKFGRRIVRIVQPDRFHRSEAQRVETAFGHDLDRHAAVEIGGGGLPLLETGLLARDQPGMEGGILFAIHRAIDVVFGVCPEFIRSVPSRGHPADIHVDGIAIDDGGDGVEESQAVCASRRADAVGKRGSSQRPGGDDGQACIREHVDTFADNFKVRERGEGNFHLGGKNIPVHRQRRSRRHRGLGRRCHGQRAKRPHLVVEQADGIADIVVRAERVRADQFGESIGLVRLGAFSASAHLGQPHLEAAPGKLPGRFASG